MEQRHDTRGVIFVAIVLVILGFGVLFISYNAYSITDFGYYDEDEIKIHQTEELTRLLNIVGFLAIVIGSLIIIMSGFNVLYEKNQELEHKIDSILIQIESKDNILSTSDEKKYE